MAEPTFARSSGQPLFALPTAGLPDGCGIAFLPASDPPGDTLTLSATWTTQPGLYLFLGQAVTDQTALVAAIQGYVGARAARFLWIANPRDEVAHWAASEIDLDPSTLSVAPPAQIAFRNVTLAIGAGCTAALNAAADAVVFTAASGATVSLLTGFGADSLAAGDTVTIPFGGDAAGTLGFSLAVTEAGLAQLDPGCRYFFPDRSSPVAGAAASVRFPVVSLGAGSLTLAASLDPINPLDPTRSAFRFLATPSSPAVAFASGFRTVYGETVTLTPITSTSWPMGPALVFAARPTLDHPSESDPYYTTFDGPFSLATAPGGTPSSLARMMCGYSGAEYAGLPSGSVSQLAFVPGRPAFARGLRRADGVSDAAPVADPAPLTAEATTAWCVLSAGTGAPLRYYAQPHDCELYQAEATPSDTPEAFLSHLEVFAGTFPDASPGNAVPMVPFGLLDAARADDAAALETQILSPDRRNRLASILAPTESGPDTGERSAATPQGLLVSLSENLAYWKLLTLAQTGGGAQKLQLASITGGFKSALQSNRLFAVVSNREEFARRCSAVAPFRLAASNWTFDLAPDRWAAHRTIVLFKYVAGATVDQLAADSATWSWPAAAQGYDDATGNLATTQADLRGMFDAAKAAATTRAEFAPFVAAITDPNWNGVLFLRAPLAATDFPDQLRGVAAGIDPARLVAHHVGAAAASVHNVGQVLTQEDSAVFGLIDYADPAPLADVSVDYAFKVLGLTVLFRNSAMASFSSRIELMINRLFGGATSQRTPGATGNNIVLDGSYQTAGGAPAYVFVLSAANVYAVTGGALDTVDVTRAQFVTLTPPGAASDTVETRFVLGGRLRFKRLSDFDVFSFGPLLSEGGALIQDGSLSFSNLLIHMSYPRATPERTAFRFDAGALAFDLSLSAARPDSLFAHFPLTLTGLLQPAPGSTPGDNGFTPVGSPLPNAELGEPWFALTFDLALGSAGSLAGSAGIVLPLLAAWSSGDAAPRTFVGLRLPGGGGTGAALTLQGVIGLTFRAIAFTAVPSPQGIDYMLRFRGIALRLLTLTFPPGQVDLCIFGDPSGGRSGVLGWYAAYAKKTDTKAARAVTGT